jgi:hypothetical protein
MNLIPIGDELVRAEDIAGAKIETHDGVLHVFVFMRGAQTEALAGMDALDFIYRVAPRALEGRRYRWARWAWAFHNLIAHPLMQALAFVGAYRLAMRVHDATIPMPRGFR